MRIGLASSCCGDLWQVTQTHPILESRRQQSSPLMRASRAAQQAITVFMRTSCCSFLTICFAQLRQFPGRSICGTWNQRFAWQLRHHSVSSALERDVRPTSITCFDTSDPSRARGACPILCTKHEHAIVRQLSRTGRVSPWRYRSDTDGIAQNAVRRFNEGPASDLVQSGLSDGWWSDETYRIPRPTNRHHIESGSMFRLLVQSYRSELKYRTHPSPRRTNDVFLSWITTCYQAYLSDTPCVLEVDGADWDDLEKRTTSESQGQKNQVPKKVQVITPCADGSLQHEGDVFSQLLHH